MLFSCAFSSSRRVARNVRGHTVSGLKSVSSQLQEHESRAWWHNASSYIGHPFPLCKPLHWRRYRGARAYRISLINVYSEALAVILLVPFHGLLLVSIIPSYDFCIAISRQYAQYAGLFLADQPLLNSFIIVRLWTENTVDRLYMKKKMEASLGIWFELEIFPVVWKKEAFGDSRRCLFSGLRHAMVFPNGALTRRPRAFKRCFTDET